jgi:hypothetical protein
MMNKKVAAFLSVLVILVFIGYMVFDSTKSEGPDKSASTIENVIYPDGNWKISEEFKVNEGALKAVSVSSAGNVYLGGDSFVSCYDNNLKLIWNIKTPAPITALAFWNDSVYASTSDQILVLNLNGKIISEWGPYEDNSIITSVSANSNYVAFADAGNKNVFILDKGGEVKKIVGQNDEKFIIPSLQPIPAITGLKQGLLTGVL